MGNIKYRYLTKMKTDNELIADFMGLEFLLGEVRIIPIKSPVQPYWVKAKYDSSWDCLMPAVYKFNNIETSEFNYKAQVMAELRIEQQKLQMLSIATPILVVYKQLVEGIKWYNTQKQ